MDKHITFAELDSESVALLPSKETLAFGTNWASVYASNSSLALNAATFNSLAQSFAGQTVTVSQSS